jgi:hypothetical protein
MTVLQLVVESRIAHGRLGGSASAAYATALQACCVASTREAVNPCQQSSGAHALKHVTHTYVAQVLH